MEIWCGVIWKYFESGVPQGHQNLFVCKCVFVRACNFAFVCVSCVCSTLSPGTSAMPPLSQFLTSLLKKYVDSDKTSPLLLRFLMGVDWSRHVFITHSQDVWFSTSLFLFFISNFILLFQIISFPNWLPWEMKRKVVNRNQLKSSCFFCVSLLHSKCRLPRGMAAASTHGISQQKAPQLASINLESSHGCYRRLSRMI